MNSKSLIRLAGNRAIVYALTIMIIGVFCFQNQASSQGFPDFGYLPPTGWNGKVFQLSQDYPTTLPANESLPWATIDFRTMPREYLEAVLTYCIEGNIDANFSGYENPVRKWYHAPWLHYGPRGREFVSGLTQERSSRRFELAATQTESYRNFAVGFYNANGGFVIGEVWKNSTGPDYSAVQFPAGTVTFKLLFTTAPTSVVPFLDGSPEWVADIDRSSDVEIIKNSLVRLLQVDIAVRDDRSSVAGWIFGTFHFDSSMDGDTPWEKLRPLALGWGSDPSHKVSDFESGILPSEGWINPESPIVIYRKTSTNPQTPKTLGLAGRINGPVDNPVSSCISCHSTAQIPAKSGMIPTAGLSDTEKLRWFRNLAVGESFDSGTKTLDFSLQLGVGIQNYLKFQESVDNLGGFFASDNRESGQLLPTESPNARNKRKTNASRVQQFEFTRDPDEDK